MKRTIRLTLDVSPEMYARIETLEKRTESGSKANLLRQAVQLYEYLVVQALDEGKEIVMRTPVEGRTEHVVELLSIARRQT